MGIGDVVEHVSAETIAHALGNGREHKNGDGSWNTRCPAHNDKGPSLTVSEGRGGKLLVHCHAGCRSEDVIDALRSAGLWPQKSQRNWTVIDRAPPTAKLPDNPQHPRLGKPRATWTYRDTDGRLVGVVHRFETVVDGKSLKELAPQSWGRTDDGFEGWCWKGFNKPRPLYGAELLKVDRKRPVLIVEGEKTADGARKLFADDYTVVSWPGGGKAVRFAHWEDLRGRDCVIWPDADAPGDQAATSIAEVLLAVGAATVKLVRLPKSLPDGWDLADEIPEGLELDRRLLAHTALDYRPVGEGIIEKYNREFALVLLGDKTVVLHEDSDHDGRIKVRYISPASFKEYFRNQTVKVGRTEQPAPNYWLAHEDRRSYRGVVFKPLTKPNGVYNLWRGFSVEPDADGDWSLLQEHIRLNVCQNDDLLYRWVIGWFAQMVQQPHKKTGTSLAIRGAMGTGKTVLGQHMGALFRDHYVLVDDNRYVLGNFNAHMASCLLLHADEAFWAGDPRHVGRLRGLVTSNTNRIEPKGKDSFEVDNFIRLMVTTNSDWVVPAGFEERRFCVLEMGEDRRQDRAFFRDIDQQLKEGGYEGLLHHLLNFDLKTTDVGVIPTTKALQQQKQHSLDPVARFWLDCLLEGDVSPGSGQGWPDRVGSYQLWKAFVDDGIKVGDRRRANQAQFGRTLKKLVPHEALGRVKVSISTTDEYGRTVAKQVWGYSLPPLTLARQYFEKVMGDKVEWDEMSQAPLTEPDVPF